MRLLEEREAPDETETPVRQRHVWLDAHGIPLPFQTHPEICRFLETAEVVSRVPVDRGVNRIDQMLLERDGIQMRAAFRDVRIQKPKMELASGRVQLNFRDDDRFVNDDRNQGNMLIDANWKLWMIDHTRSFLEFRKPKQPGLVVRCDSALWERLQTLDREVVLRELKDALFGRQIRALMERRDKLVDHIRERIEQHGEPQVLM